MAKGKMTIDVNADGKVIKEKIQRAFEDGMEEGADDMGDQGVEAGKQKLVEEGAVWKGEILASFQTDIRKQGDDVILTVSNVSDHAAPLNDGAEPDSPPPVHNLLPWVRDNLAHWTPDDMEWVDGISDYLRKHSTVDLSTWTDMELAKAYWLSQKLNDEGIDPVPFMDFAEQWLERHGEFVVRNNIYKQLKRRGLR